MKSRPVVPAALERDAYGVPFSERYGDVYHPRGGPWEQARHVFLAGNGLPERWADRPRFVVLETGFGLGNNFLATWDAWRRDAQRCERLHFISIEQHPLGRDDLAAAHAGSPLQSLADALVAAWPPLTPDAHRLEFDGGRVELLLCFGDVADWLPELVAAVDAFYLDGFAPARNPQMWQPALFKAIGRLAAPGATAATWSAARPVRDGLRSAGFGVERAEGVGGKRDITRAVWSPAFSPRRPPGRRQVLASRGHALVIGAGLAGASAARALRDCGWGATVLDRHLLPAAEGSGNPAGLFHGIVNGQDGAHARFNRAAALEAERTLRRAVADGVPGEVGGMLRLALDGDVDRMRELLARLGLPQEHLRAVDADEASALAGWPLRHPAWHYPGGGWIAPAALTRWFLDAAQADWRGGVGVASLRRGPSGWQAIDMRGEVLAEAAHVIVASAADALRLIGQSPWPTETTRGQLTTVPVATARASGLRPPRLPIAGDGYVLPALDGRIVVGATRRLDDAAGELRAADQRENLQRLERLAGIRIDADAAGIGGRVAWRFATSDRLPLIGPVPLAGVERGPREDQPRFIEREPGLWVFAALGSRGITWAPLGARLLAAWITGAPLPLEAGLVDAVDPARFAARAARRPDAQAVVAGVPPSEPAGASAD